MPQLCSSVRWQAWHGACISECPTSSPGVETPTTRLIRRTGMRRLPSPTPIPPPRRRRTRPAGLPKSRQVLGGRRPDVYPGLRPELWAPAAAYISAGSDSARLRDPRAWMVLLPIRALCFLVMKLHKKNEPLHRAARLRCERNGRYWMRPSFLMSADTAAPMPFTRSSRLEGLKDSVVPVHTSLSSFNE
jgi:hypothetical protein